MDSTNCSKLQLTRPLPHPTPARQGFFTVWILSWTKSFAPLTFVQLTCCNCTNVNGANVFSVLPKDLSLHGIGKIKPWKLKRRTKNSSFSCAWRILSLFSVSCLSLRAAIFTRLRIRCALLSSGWGKWGTSCTLVPFSLSLALRETVIYFVSRESQ